ncbi:MAG TPA: hypothetical protein ENJ32_09570 [Crenotrichaceae bacterium]|nr:hypothetical protein [Crenotrichaceae bacterium]
MNRFGDWVLVNPGKVLGLALIVSMLGVMGALKLEVNESWVENFRTSEPIFLADIAINSTLDGSNTLDIVIETPNKEDLFKSENLHRIEALQNYFVTFRVFWLMLTLLEMMCWGGYSSSISVLSAQSMFQSINESKKERAKVIR